MIAATNNNASHLKVKIIVVRWKNSLTSEVLALFHAHIRVQLAPFSCSGRAYDGGARFDKEMVVPCSAHPISLLV